MKLSKEEFEEIKDRHNLDDTARNQEDIFVFVVINPSLIHSDRAKLIAHIEHKMTIEELREQFEKDYGSESIHYIQKNKHGGYANETMQHYWNAVKRYAKVTGLIEQVSLVISE